MLSSAHTGLVVDVSVIRENEAYFETQENVYLSEQSLLPERAQGETGDGRILCRTRSSTPISDFFQGNRGDSLCSLYHSLSPSTYCRLHSEAAHSLLT